MSLFFGVSLDRMEFFTLLVQKDDTFTLQLLEYIQKRAKCEDEHEDWRAARGHTREDVLLDFSGDIHKRTTAAIIQSLIESIQVVRTAPVVRAVDDDEPQMQVTLWPDMDISNDTSYGETYLVGKRIKVYDESNLGRCALPELGSVNAKLYEFFPKHETGFHPI